MVRVLSCVACLNLCDEMITTSGSPVVTDAVPGAMAEALSLLMVLRPHSLHIIPDIDVFTKIITHWLYFISIEALMHVRVLIATPCIATQWIASK